MPRQESGENGDGIFYAIAVQVFDSIAWQHHAYRSSGIEALKWTKNNTNNTHLNALLSAWVEHRSNTLPTEEKLFVSLLRNVDPPRHLVHERSPIA